MTAAQIETGHLHTDSPPSPRGVTSDRQSSLNSDDNGKDEPDHHGSPNGSSSSSVLATPHQPVSDQFEPHEGQESKRDSADSGTGQQPESKIHEAKTHSIEYPPETDNYDEVCPLDTKTSATSPKRMSPEETKSPTTSGTDTVSTSPSTSPLRSKLSLIPSALGYAAGLLPVGKTAAMMSGDTVTSPKSPSFPENKGTSAVTNPQVDGERQLFAGTDLLSVQSSTGNIKDEATVPAPGTSWRSLTSFLGRTAHPQSQDSATTARSNNSIHPDNGRLHDAETPSTSLLLHHITSPSAIADRRRSLELGGPQQLREGFERVKAEMAGAAKELREKDARSKRDSGIVGPSALSPLSETIELGSDPGVANDSATGVCDGIDSVDWREFDIHRSRSLYSPLCRILGCCNERLRRGSKNTAKRPLEGDSTGNSCRSPRHHRKYPFANSHSC